MTAQIHFIIFIRNYASPSRHSRRVKVSASRRRSQVQYVTAWSPSEADRTRDNYRIASSAFLHTYRMQCGNGRSEYSPSLLYPRVSYEATKGT
ncbi:jg27418 [Pararge aegeria aegeria]|uniref:Jg27418 protein n=1 Tax=Pararge aegeria aegeria TaxID=348720 RepID=A0A8S4R9H8_9NEOP|nr:jg27418 [Pararge aegeria aegeria]